MESDLATRIDFRGFEARLRADLKVMKADIIKCLLGALALQTVIILGAVIALICIVNK